MWGLGEAGLWHVLLRVFDKHIDYLIKVAGLVPDAKLIVGGRSAVEDGVDVFDLFPRIERIKDIVYKVQKFADKVLDRHLFLLAEIEEHTVEAISDRAPFIFLNQPPMVQTEPQVFVYQDVKLGDDRLKQRRNGDRVVNARRYVANAKFERRKFWMRPNVPPDLGRIGYSIHLDQEIDIALILLI